MPVESAAITQQPNARSVRTFMFALATDSGPQLLAFRMSNILVGRLPDNHLSLNHGSVSRRHARISVTAKGVLVEDMGSQNGTTVNGNPVKGVQSLRPGDILRVGHVPLFYFGFVQPEEPPCLVVVDSSIGVNPMVSIS